MGGRAFLILQVAMLATLSSVSDCAIHRGFQVRSAELLVARCRV
jgi:hypothetical protein